MSTAFEVAKVAPGYISLVVLMGAGARKAWVRRRHLAVGPAGDIRQALEAARQAFTDIIAEPRRTNWFGAKERREISQKLVDVVDRCADHRLREAVLTAAASWDDSSACAPAYRALVSYASELSPGELKERGEEQARFDRQVDHARAGLDAVNDGLARLSALERRTVGRS